jgi:uncharacterized membrane protein YdjX (TVP38/TMEM64 family)
MKTLLRRRTGRWVLLLVGVVGGAWFVLSRWDATHAVGALDSDVGAAVAFVLVCVVSSVLVFPTSAALSVLAGVRFGFLSGLLVSGLALALAAWAQWRLGKATPVRGRRLVARYPALARLDAWALQNTTRVVILLRLSPLVPFGAVNYAASLRGWSPRRYAVGSLIGLAPSELVLVGLGASTGELVASVDARSIGFTIVGILSTLLVVVWGGRAATRDLEAGNLAAAADADETDPGRI